jgi:FkbM family methyltransferase
VSEMMFRMSQLRELMLSGLLSFDYETLLERRYRQWVRPGDTAVDVGAHRGRHLGALLECVGPTGKVLAFEPLPEQFGHLKETFSAPNAILHNCALSCAVGTSSFVHAQGSPEESGLRERIYNAPAQVVPKVICVEVDTLDSHIDDLLDLTFIKVDIEGGEIDCLKGAVNTLSRFRPVVSVEYGFPSYSVYGNVGSTLYDLATSQGYVLYDIFLNSLADRAVWDAAVDSIYYDYFMVPTELEAEFLNQVGGTAH